MAVHATMSRRPEGRVRFFVWSRPQWTMALLVIALAALGAWRAAELERARQAVGTVEEAVVPVLAVVPPEEAVEVEPAAAPVVAVAPVRADPLADFRLERERLRSRQLDLLQAIAVDPAASEERRREAQQRLLALWEMEAREAQIENLLRAQGIEAVAVVAETGAYVVVDTVLDAAQAARIGELASRLAGVRREAVSIVDAASGGR
ncbi:MAG: hypothetical protein BAA04_03185 [Firmicutes bacterium ZCTH02-B6]|nr:MAG: hypothetical protein BAA04_03185 [Firmicutes bacterium ZCTH02-B6]